MNWEATVAATTNRPLSEWSTDAVVRRYCFSRSRFLLQVFSCTLPPALLLAFGRAEAAGKVFWLLLGVFLVRAMLTGKRDELICLLVATAPFLSLLRSFVFYNVILVTYIVVFSYYLFSATNRFSNTFIHFRLFWGIAIWVTVYYGLSFYNTRDYSVNLRLFEPTATIFCILILSRYRSLLSAGLVGIVISAWLVGIAMLPQMGSADRLGIVEVEGRVLGNPGQLGLPLAFGFLALLFENGRWLGLQEKPIVRWIMFGVTTILLALTTSRTSWLVAFAGVVILFCMGQRQKRTLVVFSMVAVCGIAAVLASPYGNSLKKGWQRTFGENQSVRKKTSGRSDQWLVAQHAFTQSMGSMVYGYGPGLGPQTYANYSSEVPGVKYAVGKKVALHSVFMQLLVETGIVGFLCFMGWLLAVLLRLCRKFNEHGLFPFACFIGYVLTGVSVSGNDINSGVLLGLCLVGTAPALAWLNRKRGQMIPFVR